MKFWKLLPLVVLGCRPAPSPQPDAAPPPPPVLDASKGIAEEVPEASAPDSAAPQCIVAGIYHMPNTAWTPGALCTDKDPNFDGFRYKAHVAHCARSIAMSEKDEVAKLYGIPKSDYHKYEFDHFIPLNCGGSNDPKNLWPQPLDEARLKDKVEDAVYRGLNDGTMSQEEGVEKIRAWHSPACPN